jgi:hypothetical protein
MLKHLNYTDRKRIPRGDIVIQVDESDPSHFSISLPLDLVNDEQTQAVFIDITSAGSSEMLRHRIPWIDGNPACGPYSLGGIPWKRAIFDLKVVDHSPEDPGRILRRCSRMRANGAGGDAQGHVQHDLIVPAREALGEQMWTLRLGDPVTLVINSKLAMSDDEFVAHPAFGAMVFPEICRRALEWAMVSEGRTAADLADDADDAASLWVRFALDTAPTELPPPTPSGGWTSDSRGELDEWIAGVVDRVCKKHRLVTALVGTRLEEFR